MDRRKFLKLSGLMASAAVVAPDALAGAATATGRRLCRVTVIRRQCFPDLQSRYLNDPEEGPCRQFREGQQFTVGGCGAPEGFCPKAWECIRSHVDAVLSATDPLECGNAPADKAVIACCNDGTRPVVFKIEAIPG